MVAGIGGGTGTSTAGAHAAASGSGGAAISLEALRELSASRTRAHTSGGPLSTRFLGPGDTATAAGGTVESASGGTIGGAGDSDVAELPPDSTFLLPPPDDMAQEVLTLFKVRASHAEARGKGESKRSRRGLHDPAQHSGPVGPPAPHHRHARNMARGATAKLWHQRQENSGKAAFPRQ